VKPINPQSGINRRALLSAGAVLPFLPPLTATAQQKTEGSSLGFSFAVYGDSRSMMYLPYKSDQRDEAIKLMATPAENPYWKLVYEDVLKQLPAPDQQMRAAGLPGRVFPAVGNHEVWDDSDVEGLLQAFPHLKQFGVSDKRLIYTFDFNGARFIFLWTGKYDYRSPSSWDADRPRYEAQMTQLRGWLDGVKSAGIRKVFIAFHAPAFCRSGMGPIPLSQNPHQVIASYAKDVEIVVFNGHVHTTEQYEVDGVKYLLLGGGGAEQDPILPGRTSIKVPAGYPPDLYWKGQPPKEEYNYLIVDVQPEQPTRFTLNRFRPWAARPFESVELFGPSSTGSRALQ
jgi:hypothetical protein